MGSRRDAGGGPGRPQEGFRRWPKKAAKEGPGGAQDGAQEVQEGLRRSAWLRCADLLVGLSRKSGQRAKLPRRP